MRKTMNLRVLAAFSVIAAKAKAVELLEQIDTLRHGQQINLLDRIAAIQSRVLPTKEDIEKALQAVQGEDPELHHAVESADLLSTAVGGLIENLALLHFGQRADVKESTTRVWESTQTASTFPLFLQLYQGLGKMLVAALRKISPDLLDADAYWVLEECRPWLDDGDVLTLLVPVLVDREAASRARLRLQRELPQAREQGEGVRLRKRILREATQPSLQPPPQSRMA